MKTTHSTILTVHQSEIELRFYHMIGGGQNYSTRCNILLRFCAMQNATQTKPMSNAKTVHIMNWQTGDFDELHIRFDAIVL